jgi:methyl-accepting chemotaxis protein
MEPRESRAPELLRWAVPRITVPNTLAALPVGAATVFYILRSTAIPDRAIQIILVASGVVTVVVTSVVQITLFAWLRTLRRISRGKLPPTAEHLKQAAREVHHFADRLALLLTLVWISSTAVVLATMLVMLPEFPIADGLILGVRALLLFPIGLMVAYSVTIHAARSITERLCQAGLTPTDLIAAVPPTRRRLQHRLLFFALGLVATPAVLAVDLSVSLRGKVEQILGASAADEAITTVVVLAVLVLLLGLVSAVLWGASIGRPLSALAAQANQIAAGDLSATAVVAAEDEVWAVSASLLRLQEDLTRLLTGMKTAGLSVSIAAEQMLAHAESSRTGAANQASSVHQTTSATEEMARVAEQIADKAGAVADTAAQTLEAARSGQESSRVFADAIASLARDNLAVANAVVRLKKGMQQIGRIVEFINGIADKSDLLALNAELEGTKAGELGRGFSLVAGEMRRLAENILRSTREITQLIEGVRAATQEAVSATQTGIHATETGARVAEQLSRSLQKIVELAQITAESATTINFATQQQRSSSAQLAETMASILEVTQNTETATNQVSGSSADLANLARQLKSAVDGFKLGERDRQPGNGSAAS